MVCLLKHPQLFVFIFTACSNHFLVCSSQPVALTGFRMIVGDGLRSPSESTDFGDSNMLILGSSSSSDKSIIFQCFLFLFQVLYCLRKLLSWSMLCRPTNVLQNKLQMLLFGKSQKIACSDDSLYCVRIGHKKLLQTRVRFS